MKYRIKRFQPLTADELAGVLIALAIAFVSPEASAQFSPGPLARDHAALDGELSCNRCHVSGKRIAVSECLKCHDRLGAEIATRRGLHGKEYRGRDCGGCHVDHVGRDAKLVRWPGGSRDKFDHKLAGWILNGKHAEISCAACHKQKNSVGDTTYLGLKTECASCHKDPHAGRLGKDCDTCHIEKNWIVVRLEHFNHDQTRYPLIGKHRQVKCEKCHAGTPPRYRGIKFARCNDCHKDPHHGKFTQPCSTCHTVNAWRDVGRFREEHPRLSLANGHHAVPCEKCHDRGNTRPPSRGRQCVSCHKPVHKAKFGENCAKCHAEIRWLGVPVSVGVQSHALTLFPLRGAHRQTPCAKCHKPSLPVNERYRRLEFSRCTSCHADSHKGEFAGWQGGDCAQCHSEQSYRPTTFTFAMHEKTKFALAGRHLATPCSSCHTGPTPRLDLRVPQRECSDCHKNPHGTQFAREMAQGGCAHCHNARDWHNANIDHSIWPLTGAHAEAKCSACHTPSESDRRKGQGASYRGIPRNCEGCHDDAHAGQFRLSQPKRACDFCHTTKTFKVRSFEHAKLAKFPLEGAHRKLECKACHASTRLGGGKKALRYRLGYRDCRDCHANPHVRRDVAASGAANESITDRTDCRTCHTEDKWRMEGVSAGSGSFDHDKTGFPLRGQHGHVGCTQCHHPGAKAHRDCVSCHTDPHEARLGRSCETCHTARTWRDTKAIEMHRRTRLPLTGMHVLLDCTQCHLRRGEREWSSPPADCFACHESDYRKPGLFPNHQGSATEPAFPRDCSACHRTAGWRPARTDHLPTGSLQAALRSASDHDVHFPISYGSHRAAPCASCHLSAQTPSAVRCDGCHVHNVVRLIELHKRPLSSVDGAACLSCHPRGMRR